MVLTESNLEVVHVPLPFRVFILTSDGQWTLKGAFATRDLAGSWVIGLSTSGVECKIFEELPGGLFEITPEAVRGATEAIMKRELGK